MGAYGLFFVVIGEILWNVAAVFRRRFLREAFTSRTASNLQFASRRLRAICRIQEHICCCLEYMPGEMVFYSVPINLFLYSLRVLDYVTLQLSCKPSYSKLRR
jgi:hypothetical protein